MNAYYVFLKFAKLWELQAGSGFSVQGSGTRIPRTANLEP